MRCEIRHITEYNYPSPAWDSFNQVRLHPSGEQRQSVLSFNLEVSPEAEVSSYKDYFGSLVHHVHVRQEHLNLKIEAQAIVETHAVEPPSPTPFSAVGKQSAKNREFLTPCPRVPEGNWSEIFEVQKPNSNTDLTEFLFNLNTFLNKRFTYDSSATNVRTPLAEFAQLNRGVCQDFTHAMLGILRHLGIPARYVSGYLYSGGEMLGAEATHAWVEAFIPDYGWLGYDPTNNCIAKEKHIKIGHGREYSDVSPVRGSYYGGGDGKLEVAVHVYSQ